MWALVLSCDLMLVRWKVIDPATKLLWPTSVRYSLQYKQNIWKLLSSFCNHRTDYFQEGTRLLFHFHHHIVYLWSSYTFLAFFQVVFWVPFWSFLVHVSLGESHRFYFHDNEGTVPYPYYWTQPLCHWL